MGQAAPLYLEDLAAGQTFRSGAATVELGAVKAFAAAFDPQPFHLAGWWRAAGTPRR
jgi:hypothetical protein